MPTGQVSVWVPIVVAVLGNPARFDEILTALLPRLITRLRDSPELAGAVRLVGPAPPRHNPP